MHKLYEYLLLCIDVQSLLHMYVYVRIYTCMYVHTILLIHVHMYVCMTGSGHLWVKVHDVCYHTHLTEESSCCCSSGKGDCPPEVLLLAVAGRQL